MTFAWPFLLWLLIVPAVWLAWEFARPRRASSTEHPNILQAEAGMRSVEIRERESRPEGLGSQSRVRGWLALGLAFGIVGLARPQWGWVDEPVFDQSREVIVALDLSRSMMTADVKPSRLERAKLLIQSLLDRLVGERIGMVVFSGTAFLQSPLSADYEILREFLPSLGPDFMPEGGTNYGALIDTAADAFGTGPGADRFLIILSDGEATDDNWRSHVRRLTDKGIRVIGLGVGTAAGALIPDGSGGYVKDDRGAIVMSKLESDTLRELADKTGGVYRDASTWVDLAQVIRSTVDAGQKGRFVEKNTIRYVERFQWALAPALLCLFISFWREFPVRPKPRHIRLGAAAASLLCAIFFPTLARAAAKTESAPLPGALLGRIVARMSAQNSSSARDWSELATETATWGEQLQSAGQRVPEGPVHDGLAAVDSGSALDPRAADWEKLRSRLEALLRKPEDKKEQQQQQNQKQDQSKSRQSQQNQGSPQQNQKQDQPQNGSQSNPQSSPKSEPNQAPSSPPPDSSGFGKMKPPAQPPQSGTQQVGGAPEHKRPDPAEADPALAAPLQKLEQVRAQDSPAELYQMIENNEPHPAPKQGKNW